MRDLSTGPSLLSVNTATVRKQAGLLEIIEACARHGIAAISPWRDQVATVGLERAGQAIKDAGLKLSGYCRGGLFPATGEHVMAVRDDNRRTVDEAAALGAPCVILVAGGDLEKFHAILAPTVPLSRHIFRAPTRFYKTGVVFMAYLNGHQDHFTMVGGQESARSTLHLAELFRLADKAGLFRDPERAAARMKAVLAVRGVAL